MRSPPPAATPRSTAWPTACAPPWSTSRRWRRRRRRSCSPTCWPPPIAPSPSATPRWSPPAACWWPAACSTPRPTRWPPASPRAASAARPPAASRAGPASPSAMRRFTLPPERLADGRVTFDADESRHLARVLRLRPGDTVIATDGAGRDYTVRLDSVGDNATGTVLTAAPGTPPSPLAVTLVQGVPKGDKMETIVRAATELGVARVWPALCERTIVRLEPSRWRDRARRWQRVAREAAKQCGRAVLPEVETPRPLAECLVAAAHADLALCCWEGGGVPLAEALSAAAAPRAALLV